MSSPVYKPLPPHTHGPADLIGVYSVPKVPPRLDDYPDSFWQGTEALAKFMNDFFSWDKIEGTFASWKEAITDAISWAWNEISKTYTDICNTLGSWANMVSELGNLAWAQITKTYQNICDTLGSWANMVSVLGNLAWTQITKTASNIWDTLKALVGGWTTMIVDWGNLAWSQITKTASDVMSTIASWANILAQVGSMTYTQISTALYSWARVISGLGNMAMSYLTGAWTDFLNIVGTAWSNFWNALTTRPTALTAIGALSSGALSSLTQIVTGLFSGASGVGKFLADFWTNLTDPIKLTGAHPEIRITGTESGAGDWRLRETIDSIEFARMDGSWTPVWKLSKTQLNIMSAAIPFTVYASTTDLLVLSTSYFNVTELLLLDDDIRFDVDGVIERGTTNLAEFTTDADGRYGIIFGSGSDKHFIPHTANYHYLGTPDYYWFYVYAGHVRYHTLAEFESFDDLSVAKQAKGMTIVDEKTGREKHVFDPKSFPPEIAAEDGFFDAGNMSGFLLGCIRQLTAKVENLEKRLKVIA